MPRAHVSGVATVVSLLALAPATASATTITVNDVGDVVANDGDCVLREAITAANDNAASGAMAGECAAGDALPTVDTIDFSIAGGGPHTIAPLTPLPDLDESMTIDGGLTDPNVIVLDGVNVSTTVGFSLQSPGGHNVRRLAIVNFDRGLEVGFSGAPSTIELNRVGTNFGNDPFLGNEDGIQINGDGNTIRDNVISGNGTGIFIFTGAENNIVDNRIGTNAAGTSALANGVGITVFAADENVIGGSTEADRNVMSGNIADGVEVTGGDGNRIVGNLIGTDATGTAGLSNGAHGIQISTTTTGTVVGTAEEGEGNVISGNVSDGIEAAGPGTVVDGNLIGTNEAGDASIANGFTGVEVGTRDVTVGTSAAGNVISGHDGVNDPAVLVESVNSLTGVVIEGNRIGTAADGLSALPNTEGIRVEGETDGLQILNNLISGNDGDGIKLDADIFRTVAGTVIQGNQVGNALDGSSLGNGGQALNVVGAEGTLIGGTAIEDLNAFNSSGADGVSIGADASSTALVGNHINLNDDLGIDLAGGSEDGFGITANDTDDVDGGANDLQNFPVLAAAVAGGQTAVTGSLNSTPDTDFLIEFFRSPAADASGHGEGLTPLGAVDVSTDADGDAVFGVGDLATTSIGEPVTATATELDANGDPLSTSEFAENATAQDCDVTGTGGDDPALAGTSADEVICGLEGDDVIDPGGGDDVIVGGAGSDKLDLSAAAAAIDLDLSTGAGTVGPEDLGALAIEDVTGGDFDDAIEGDAGSNTLAGGDGADTLLGDEEADTLKGGDGTDTIRGQGGGDMIKGQDGSDDGIGGDGGDELQGGGGREDELDGNDGKDSFDGGDGSDDDCNGGPNKDETPAPGCERKTSIP